MELMVCNRKTIELVLPKPNDCVISIYGTDDGPVKLKDGWKAILRIRFDDIDDAVHGYMLFNEAHAKTIYEFVSKFYSSKDGMFFIQCEAGISRSAGVAVALADHVLYKDYAGYYPLFNRHIYRILSNYIMSTKI